MTEKRVLLGAIVRAHGVKGEVRVKSFAQDPQSLGAYGMLTTDDGQRFEITELRAIKAGEVVMRFAGVLDRSAAQRLKGQRLYVDRSALPAPGAGEFYHTDLIGLRVENAAGDVVGTISAVHNFGAGDLIEVEFRNGNTEFIAFTDTNVPVVDIAAGRIVIGPPSCTGDE